MGERYLLEKERRDALRKVPHDTRKDVLLFDILIKRKKRGDGIWDGRRSSNCFASPGGRLSVCRDCCPAV
jgi:hypothetical protein